MMPHLTVEYSANLAEQTDMNALCLALHQAMVDCGLFELGAIRVRALQATHYAVADRLPENAFAALYLRIGRGRTAGDVTRAGQMVFDAATTALATLFDRPHFALTLEIIEIDPALSWKKNAIHPRLRAQGGNHV
jgi:5-carboxymethyl-2-hydroxymuconate isomerase